MRLNLQQSAPVQWVLQLQVDWALGTGHAAAPTCGESFIYYEVTVEFLMH